MTAILKKAARGSRADLTALYKSNVQKVFYISRLFFGSTAEAEEATISSFHEIWKELGSGKIQSEEGFTNVCVAAALKHCKREMLKKDPSALSVPAEKEFEVKDIQSSLSAEGTMEAFILRQFDDLQKLVLIMHTVCQYNKDQMKAMLDLDLPVINAILDAEEQSIQRAIRFAGKGKTTSYSKVVLQFIHLEKDCTVPKYVRGKIEGQIDELAAPVEEKMGKAYRALIWTAVILFVCCIGVACLFYGNNGAAEQPPLPETEASTDISQETTAPTAEETTAETEAANAVNTYYADIVIQDYGTITVQLDAEAAPATVENFISLAESGFYDGLTFHRIIEDFMMQGGDPNGDGTGGSEDTIVGEFRENGYDNPLSHTRGAISMARSSDYDSASSQFFIVQKDSTYLDGQYAVFGYVTEGMEIVDAICEEAEPTDSNGSIAKNAQPVITTITVTGA